MDDERYFTEFFETLEAKTRSWIQSIGRHTHLGPYDLSSGLGNYINRTLQSPDGSRHLRK